MKRLSAIIAAILLAAATVVAGPQNPCNPCAKKAQNLCNPCAGKAVKVKGGNQTIVGYIGDSQCGRGVFQRSIEALQRLNGVGYGVERSGLVLNLIYNPVGAFLPPPQASIEADFKREMMARYGVSFNRLYTITNMPINRFLDYLRRSGNEDRYMRKLVEAFNPRAVDGLMCRTLVSVDWLGRLYDCDFNQMIGKEIGGIQIKW